MSDETRRDETRHDDTPPDPAFRVRSDEEAPALTLAEAEAALAAAQRQAANEALRAWALRGTWHFGPSARDGEAEP